MSSSNTIPASVCDADTIQGSATADRIHGMREACRVAAVVLDRMAAAVKPGVTTYDLDRLGKACMDELGAESACYGYSGQKNLFPAYTCISINEEVVHGIGSLDHVIQDGDVVSLDVVTRYRGYIGDNARTVIAGDAGDDAKRRLVKVTEEALMLGIEQARPGNRVGDISYAIQHWVEKHGFNVIREYVGHGVGLEMHEHPQIPNYGKRRTGPVIVSGMTLAIEPMVLMGDRNVRLLPDGWTVVSRDGKPAAHFEHTVLVTNKGAEVLTRVA